jgi:hypothetical protein
MFNNIIIVTHSKGYTGQSTCDFIQSDHWEHDSFPTLAVDGGGAVPAFPP